MKQRKTLISVYLKAPTIVRPDRMDDMKTVIYEQIAEEFGCEKQISYAFDQQMPGILTFYIFRAGRFKNSMKNRLEKTLERMKKYWAPMVGYSVVTTEIEE